MIAPSPARMPRHGLSLLEVLVALAIFLFSIVALHQALNIGTNNAIETQQLQLAAQLAQSKMAEVYAGVVPLSSTPDTPFDENPDYTWSIDAQQSTLTNLWNVNLSVKRTRGDGTVMETKLSQMIIDPSLRGTSYDSAATQAAATASSSSSTSGTSTGGSKTGN